MLYLRRAGIRWEWASHCTALCIMLTFEPCDCVILTVSDKAITTRLHGCCPWTPGGGGGSRAWQRRCQPEVHALSKGGALTDCSCRKGKSSLCLIFLFYFSREVKTIWLFMWNLLALKYWPKNSKKMFLTGRVCWPNNTPIVRGHLRTTKLSSQQSHLIIRSGFEQKWLYLAPPHPLPHKFPTLVLQGY